jgi:hypothetical protein
MMAKTKPAPKKPNTPKLDVRASVQEIGRSTTYTVATFFTTCAKKRVSFKAITANQKPSERTGAT